MNKAKLRCLAHVNYKGLETPDFRCTNCCRIYLDWLKENTHGGSRGTPPAKTFDSRRRLQQRAKKVSHRHG